MQSRAKEASEFKDESALIENVIGEKIINDWVEALTRNSGSFSDYLSLMLGKPGIRLNNLKTSLRFPCLGLNPIIHSIILFSDGYGHPRDDWQKNERKKS